MITNLGMLTAPELAERVKNGPVTIMVPDFGDPCGTRKIPRSVSAAFSADMPNGLGGWTVGRWTLHFDGPYLYPPILVTTAAWPYPVTDTDPAGEGDSGPCDRCRRTARDKADRDAAEAAARAAADRAERDQGEAARQAGYDRGREHFAIVEAYGAEHDHDPAVPDGYDDGDGRLATFWLDGWNKARDEHEEGEGE